MVGHISRLFSRTILTRNIMYSIRSGPPRSISTLVMPLRNRYVTTDISVIKCNLGIVRTSHIRPFNIASDHSTALLRADNGGLQGALSFPKQRARQ